MVVESEKLQSDKYVIDKAENHWKFLEKWLHMIFVDSFIHGYKHAIEDVENKKN